MEVTRFVGGKKKKRKKYTEEYIGCVETQCYSRKSSSTRQALVSAELLKSVPHGNLGAVNATGAGCGGTRMPTHNPSTWKLRQENCESQVSLTTQ